MVGGLLRHRTGLLFLAGACLALAALAAAEPAAATKRCQAVTEPEEGKQVKVGAIGVDCATARETILGFYEAWHPQPGPHYYDPIMVGAFLCGAGSSGADVACHAGDRWIFATTRPYVDITELHPPRPEAEAPPPKPEKKRRPYWTDCGLPASYALSTVIAHRVPCAKARGLIRKVWRAGQEAAPGTDVLYVKSFACRLEYGLGRAILCERDSHRVRGPLPG